VVRVLDVCGQLLQDARVQVAEVEPAQGFLHAAKKTIF
jgi:hypothetical protein